MNSNNLNIFLNWRFWYSRTWDPTLLTIKTTEKIKLTKQAVSRQTKENCTCYFKELGILVWLFGQWGNHCKVFRGGITWLYLCFRKIILVASGERWINDKMNQGPIWNILCNPEEKWEVMNIWIKGEGCQEHLGKLCHWLNMAVRERMTSRMALDTGYFEVLSHFSVQEELVWGRGWTGWHKPLI